MRLPYRLRVWIDDKIGFHGDCLCNYADYAAWENGKIVAMYVDGVKFVPESTEKFYWNVHVAGCNDEYCGGCIPIHPDDLKDMNK